MSRDTQLTVVVTGATGFLGRSLCGQLAAAGHRLRAPVRATSRTAPIEAFVDCHVASLSDPSSLARVFEGADVVVHAAGGGRTTHPDQFAADNLMTTLGVADAAEAAGVPRVVLVSSMAAGGPRPSADAPWPEAPLSLYGRAKQDAERLLLARSAFETQVIRPPGLYGAGDDRMLPMFRAARRGWMPVPTLARASAFLHVDDCASAIVALITRWPAAGGVYGISDGPARDWSEIARVVGASVGTRPRVVRVPMWALRGVGAASEAVSRLRDVATIVHRDKVRDMHGAWWISESAALEADTGWAPRVSFEDGMAQTAAWYREQGLLDA